MIFFLILEVIDTFIRYVQNRDGNIIFTDEIQCKSSTTYTTLRISGCTLMAINIFIKRKGIIFFCYKIIIVLEGCYFGLIFLTHPLEILSNTLRSITNHILILLTKLMDDRQIITTSLILIIILGIGIIGVFYSFEVFIIEIYISI